MPVRGSTRSASGNSRKEGSGVARLIHMRGRRRDPMHRGRDGAALGVFWLLLPPVLILAVRAMTSGLR